MSGRPGRHEGRRPDLCPASPSGLPETLVVVVVPTGLVVLAGQVVPESDVVAPALAGVVVVAGLLLVRRARGRR